MKISGRTVEMNTEFALNPQVLPFFPRSLMTKSSSTNGTGGVVDDVFHLGYSEFSGHGLQDDVSADRTRWDGILSQLLVEKQTKSTTFDVTPQLNESLTLPLNDLVAKILGDGFIEASESLKHTGDTFEYARSSHNSKLLDGIWGKSVNNQQKSVSQSLMFDCLQDCNRNGDKPAPSFPDEMLKNSATFSKGCLEAGDHCSTDYYTPFGSGFALGQFGASTPVNKVESAESVTGQLWGLSGDCSSWLSLSGGSDNKTQQSDRQTDGVWTTRKHMHTESLNIHLDNLESNLFPESVDRNTPKYNRTVGYPSHKAFPSAVSGGHSHQIPKPSSVPLDYGKQAGRNCSVSSDAAKQNKLTPEQQLFIRELNRLPPLLRQQYLEFMATSQQLSSLSLTPAYQTIPGIVCQVGSLSLNQTTPVMIASLVPQDLSVPVIAFQQPVPGLKVIRRTGAANELHMRLEECYEQFKLLENERKKTEAELARQNPGRMVSSDNSRPLPSLPSNPSRVDRLIVDSLREHTKVATLLERMEQLRDIVVSGCIHDCISHWAETTAIVEACRREEIANAICRHRTKNSSQMEKDRDVLALASSLSDLTFDLRRARTALWCSLQLASSDLPLSCVDAAKRAVAKNVSSDRQPESLHFPKSVTGLSCPQLNNVCSLAVDCGDDEVFTDETLEGLPDEMSET